MKLQNPVDESFHPAELLRAIAKHKDRSAFIRLYEYYAPRVKSFLMKGGFQPDQADELAQETMLNVWRKADQYDPRKAAASTWIFTIARNQRIDALRRRPRAEIDPADPLMIEDNSPAPAESLDKDTERNVMAKALQSLPEEQASLIYKSFYEDKTHRAIADETGLPLGTVKSRIRMALDKLRGAKSVRELRS